MSYYAMVVVVEAGDLDSRDFERATRSLMHEDILFQGEPWQVVPVNQYPDNTPAGEAEPFEEPEFDTLSALDQHPERLLSPEKFGLVVALEGEFVTRSFDAEDETIDAVGEAINLKAKHPDAVVTLVVTSQS